MDEVEKDIMKPIFIVYIFILGIYGALLLIDGINSPAVAELINKITEKYMVTEWIAITGFIISVFVPAAFYKISEHNRQKDKKDADKQIENMRIENEKQFICNIINGYRKLYWNNDLICILYNNDENISKDTSIILLKESYTMTLYSIAREKFYEESKNDMKENESRILCDSDREIYNIVLLNLANDVREEVVLVTLINQLITDEKQQKYLQDLKNFLIEQSNEIMSTYAACNERNELRWPFEEMYKYEV